MDDLVPLAAPAFAPHPHQTFDARASSHLIAPERHRADRQPRRPCHRRDAAVAQRLCLRAGP